MTGALKAVAVLAIFLGSGGILFAWSGLYSVAASSGHFPMVQWFLHYALQRSVATQSLAVGAPPPLDDPALLRRGAGHYDSGCAPCHGAPGTPRQGVPLRMLPQPPYLPEAAKAWTTKELFWIVRHGLKYTGMPSWPAPEREDEVWAMVAFLRALPPMTPEIYRTLARGEFAETGSPADALFPTGESALAGCARCHGRDGAGDPNGAFPRLDIHDPAYIERALRDYAAGLRPSGIMEPQAHGLSDDEIGRLARHFSGQSGPAHPAEHTDPDLLRYGESIARGEAGLRIPACASCHGLSAGPANPDYPALTGQYPSYIEEQIRLWKEGRRGDDVYSRIMAAVAGALGEREIEAVAAFYGSLEPARQDGVASAADPGRGPPARGPSPRDGWHGEAGPP